MVVLKQLRTRWREPYFRYLVIVSLAGWLLAIWGVAHVARLGDPGGFLLLMGLSIMAQLATTSTPVPHSSITYSVAPAVGMAALRIYGPWSAVVVEAVSSLAIWRLKKQDPEKWKRSLEQLAFNVGMSSLSVFVAGWLFKSLWNWLPPDRIWLEVSIWLLTAIVYEQINLWLVVAIIALQGKATDARQMWRQNWWASTLNVAVLSVGGGTLAYAGLTFGRAGLAVFFLPILLSAYAFRLYVRQMQAHMSNLESIVAERTRELAASNAALQALHEEKNAFLAVLAHDMRSPLTSIGLHGELIRRFPERLAEKPQLAEAILHSQQLLADIVNNILDLEMLQAGGTLQLRRETLELQPFVEAVVQIHQEEARRKQLALEFSAEIPYVQVSADRQQLERALDNLISNAIKYTPAGGSIHARLCAREGCVAIEVRDTGYGIPAEDLPHVFERFRRVDKHKHYAAGTGLGLAITRAIVEAHDGRLEVVSQEGVGSAFTIRLPHRV